MKRSPNPSRDPVPTDTDSAWSRRSFMGATSIGVAGLAKPSRALAMANPARRPLAIPHPLIDVNVTLGQWPLRRLPLDDPSELVAKLRTLGVTQAWAASFESLLHKDLAAANTRLARDCQRQGSGLLLPFGTIDPTRPDWMEELRRCTEDHRMPGLRLYPNYHGYRLDHPAFAALLRAAAERRRIVQLALVMEDERMMHPLLRVEPVDTAPLAAIVRELPTLRLVLVNALRTLRAKPLLDLVATDKVSVEIAMCEGLGGIENLLQQIPASRVLFGSHAPLFYPEAATFKLRESILAKATLQAIAHQNANRLLHPTRSA